MKTKCDVAVIGAGTAGLVCAHELLKHGLNVQVLEAQSRIGGRVDTRREAGLQTPLELGAEFIHGTPKTTMSFLEFLGLPFYDGCDNHLFFDNGKLHEFNGFWDEIGKLIKRLDTSRMKDQSVLNFLDSQKKADTRSREAFLSYVEGFHAADPHVMSEKGLAETEQTDESDLNSSRMFRIPGGYDQLVQGIFHSFPSDDEILMLQTTVKKIKWKKGSVQIQYQGPAGTPLKSLQAQAVVVTVPLGVLKAPISATAAIEFAPCPKALTEALSGLEMGDVQRITFHFRTRFWDRLSKEPIGFLHARTDKYFPTWWTLMPMRTPLLVAWQGGPKAGEMSLWSEEEKIKTALHTLSEITGESFSALTEQVLGWATHDWTRDPFFLGAYSYVAVGGSEKAKRLSRGFDDTLFFAGEATVSGPARGTVHGAFQSGIRAARQILKKNPFSFASKEQLNSIFP